MEDGMVLHVQRVLNGQPIYTEPSLEWTPFIYPPLYYYISAAIASVLGVGFIPLRFVSVVSILCVAVIIGLFVNNNDNGSYFPGITAGLLFISMYKITGAWFTLARIDSFYLLLLFATLSAVYFGSKPTHMMLAGVIGTFGFFTKQTTGIVIIFLFIYLLIDNRQLCMVFISTVISSVSSIWIIAYFSTGGMFSYYIFTVSSGHPYPLIGIIEFLTTDLLKQVPFLITLSIIFFWNRYKQSGISSDLLFYIIVSLGLLLTSFLPRVKAGGGLNNMMPIYAFLCVIIGELLKDIRITSEFNILDDVIPDSKYTKSFVLLLIVFQLIANMYLPTAYVPMETNEEKITQQFSELPEDIYSPEYPYTLTRAGYDSRAHGVAVHDVMRSENKIGTRFRSKFNKEMDNKEIDAIILTRHSEDLIQRWYPGLVKNYQKCAKLNPSYPETIIGFEAKPELVYKNCSVNAE